MTHGSELPPIVIFGLFSSDEIGGAAARAADAAAAAEVALDEIRGIMGRLNQIQILSRMALLMIMATPGGTERKGDAFLQPHELELLQAVALSHVQITELDAAAIPVAVERLLHLVKEHTRAVQQTSLAALSTDPQRNRVEAIVDRMRMTTYTTRGPRHAYQTRAYVRALATDMDGRFQATLGFTVSDIADFMDGFAYRASRVLADLQNSAVGWMKRDKPEQMLELFLAHNPSLRTHHVVTELQDGTIPPSQTWAALHAVFQEQIFAAFRIDWPPDSPQLDRLRERMRTLALGFGGIGPEAFDHLKLGNPVRTKPFVMSSDGDLYLFCTQTCLANLVEMIDEIASGDAKLKVGCEDFKADWLERRLQQLVRDAFPSGATFDNPKWKDADGRDGETDCILTIDKSVGLFEAKSGRITAPARRGAKDRLRREIETLLVAPSRQSERLAKLLRSTKDSVALSLPQGKGKIQPSDVRDIFRVNILFDTLGPLTAGTRRLVEAGFIDSDEPMAPTMSIFELETLFDLLPDQISRLHYLRRREELERSVLVEADEMDLIALYLESSFCIPRLEEAAGGFGIYGWSDRISHIYDHEGRHRMKASLKRTAFWEGMLSTVERRCQPGWTRFGFRLSNIGYRDQWTVLRRRDQVAKRARRVLPGQAVHSGALDGDGSNRNVIGLCVGKDVSIFGIWEHARTTATAMTDLMGGDEALVLYWDVGDKPPDVRFTASFIRGRK